MRVRYLHATSRRSSASSSSASCASGGFDVLVGINLLREGLDIPEVSLVAILDADKEGFLRSERSLIQTIGRAARNVNGAVLLYADRDTDSMRETLSETERRREIQGGFNEEHGITPETVVKRISSLRDSMWEGDYVTVPVGKARLEPEIPTHEIPALIERLRREMPEAAKELDFERAAVLRDRIRALDSGARLR